MALREKPYTAEEFWEIVNPPENEDRHQDGVIVEIAKK